MRRPFAVKQLLGVVSFAGKTARAVRRGVVAGSGLIGVVVLAVGLAFASSWPFGLVTFGGLLALDALKDELLAARRPR